MPTTQSSYEDFNYNRKPIHSTQASNPAMNSVAAMYDPGMASHAPKPNYQRHPRHANNTSSDFPLG